MRLTLRRAADWSANRPHKRTGSRWNAHRLMAGHQPSVDVHDLDKLILTVNVQPFALLSRRDNHLSRRDRQIGHPVRRNASILIVALQCAANQMRSTLVSALEML